MKLITAIIKPFKLQEVKDALVEAGVDEVGLQGGRKAESNEGRQGSHSFHLADSVCQPLSQSLCSLYHRPKYGEGLNNDPFHVLRFYPN